MFKYTHVLNKSSGEMYYINKATLENGEGYDESPCGANSFSIDLQPEDPKGKPIYGIDLVIPNDSVPRITRNLDAEHKYISSDVAGTVNDPFVNDLVDTLVEGNTIIVINQ